MCDAQNHYVSLAAEALGIEREDTFRKYTHWGNLDRILHDAAPLIRQSPFSRERIIEVLTQTFCDVSGCPPDRM
jgi:heterodisulfide reductase subunit D